LMEKRFTMRGAAVPFVPKGVTNVIWTSLFAVVEDAVSCWALSPGTERTSASRLRGSVFINLYGLSL
jgi:hypothetical protein